MGFIKRFILGIDKSNEERLDYIVNEYEDKHLTTSSLGAVSISEKSILNSKKVINTVQRIKDSKLNIGK